MLFDPFSPACGNTTTTPPAKRPSTDSDLLRAQLGGRADDPRDRVGHTASHVQRDAARSARRNAERNLTPRTTNWQASKGFTVPSRLAP